MNIPTFDFTGDAVTYFGLIGVVSSVIVIVAAYRRFWTSPYRD